MGPKSARSGAGTIGTLILAATLAVPGLMGEAAVSAAQARAARQDHGCCSDRGPGTPAERTQLVVVPDQAAATLDVLQQRAGGGVIREEGWTALFATEGYRRMMEREQAINEWLGRDRGINDESFRRWATSDAALEDLPGRAAGLEAWGSVDVETAGALALAYLPEHARLRATIYPLIREQTNSFVHDLGGERPAIFMYVEPGQRPAEVEHVLAHELHHVGLTGACRGTAEDRDLPRSLLTGFAEGVAVLAAAGGPDADTHPVATPAQREAWALRMASVESDMAAFEAFMDSVFTGRLTEEEARARVFRFVATDDVPQGPFYSLGWLMASTVERELGRETLVDGLCRPERLLLDYDVAATAIGARDPDAAPPRWSDRLLDRLRERVGRV